MEVHSRVHSVMAKRLWNFLRVSWYMMRKGLLSKRKLLMDMNLMMKRGKVLGKKSLGSLMFHHHHRSGRASRGYELPEYEFSCSNSPMPVIFHVVPKRKHHYPCINPPHDPETPPPSRAVVAKIEPSPEYSNFQFDQSSDFVPGEQFSPMVSPFSVSVSNFSAMEIEGGSRQVDNDAEQFIKRFYEQLRAQSRTALIQYQEMEFQAMLARGT